jgi:hypothetical protein
MLKTLLLFFLFVYLIVRFSGGIVRVARRINRIFSSEDEIVIRRTSPYKKSRRHFTDGEYIDYEEVK